MKLLDILNEARNSPKNIRKEYTYEIVANMGAGKKAKKVKIKSTKNMADVAKQYVKEQLPGYTLMDGGERLSATEHKFTAHNDDQTHMPSVFVKDITHE